MTFIGTISKTEQFEEYLHDILVTEFKYTEGQADKLTASCTLLTYPEYEDVPWDGLWGEAYEWAEELVGRNA